MFGGEGGARVIYVGWLRGEVFPGGAEDARVSGRDDVKEGSFLCVRAVLMKHFGRSLKSCSCKLRSCFVVFRVGSHRVRSLSPVPFSRRVGVGF